ncbi:DUF1000-domain-containing protein [Thelephora ganbajun]|uniref:DUF1000-domain-containing protein n=1 Tax=Thelephora ganbajun TaxID=370292 RepID=A0ACB6ZV55_THEGA|nr:DUF1000-domain-containing protein [Thelephora ganbajun]
MSASEHSNTGNFGSETGNLYGVIDKYNVHGLNLTVPEDAKAIIKPWDEREDTTRYADSNVDDQVVIHIPFAQNVRLRSISLKLGRGELAPRHLRIYANHTTIVDFEDAEVTKPQLNVTLQEGEVGVIEYPLNTPAFANIHSLSIFFGEAVGGEVTRLYYIGFRGDTRTPRKEGHSKLEIPAANAADASLTDRLQEKAGGQQTTAR